MKGSVDQIASILSCCLLELLVVVGLVADSRCFDSEKWMEQGGWTKIARRPLDAKRMLSIEGRYLFSYQVMRGTCEKTGGKKGGLVLLHSVILGQGVVK